MKNATLALVFVVLTGSQIAKALNPEQAKEALANLAENGMLSATVVVTLKPGADIEKAFLAAVAEVKPAIVGEAGNNGVFVVSKSPFDPTKYTFYGEWGHRSAILEHMGYPHSQKFMQTIEPLMPNGMNSIDVTITRKFK